eukprot:TRINITY_DN4129_c0_g1_i4.p2 TRINITY_DN4129_c0_g1~~TRINITY_DN4129_c0_g1_i4.p2  ORF type:complete len:162 (-),score=44.79 TRINITY_DN4129_c0_g1_i4:122-607(-)
MTSVNLDDLLKPSNGDYAALVGTDGKEVELSTLKGKVVGLYFSAHWCPPCRRFTPELVSTYNTLKKENKNFEVVFVSCDNSEHEFMEYFMSMGWLAVPFDDANRRKNVAQHFGVQGIPCLVIIGEDGQVITKSGVNGVYSGGVADFPWDKYAESRSSCAIL